jgi:hypothetical protein
LAQLDYYQLGSFFDFVVHGSSVLASDVLLPASRILLHPISATFVVNRNLAEYMGILDRKQPLLPPLLQPVEIYRSCHNACRLAEPGRQVGSSCAAVARLVVAERRVLVKPDYGHYAGSA